MDIVFGNNDDLLTDNKTKISDTVIEKIKKINSKTALRRDMAQAAYFIINDKEIEDKVKIDLIKKLQEIYDKAKEELIKKKLVVEDEDEKVKTQQVELNKRIVLAKHPNRNGNLLKSININVNSSNYPISARDQVDFFLLDIAEEFDILMNPDKADAMLEDKSSRIIETTAKIVPNNFKKGKETNDDKKNSAAPDLGDVEDAKTVSNSSSSKGSSDVSLGGKKRKTRKTRKNRKNTGGTKLSREQREKLRDTLKFGRNKSIIEGTPYPRRRTRLKTLEEEQTKFMDNLFFPRDYRAYRQLEKIEKKPTKDEHLKNKTQTNDFVQEAKEDPVAQGYASLANKGKDQLDNLSPDEQELFNNLSYEDQDLLIERAKSKRTYRPDELEHRTQTISKQVQKEINAIQDAILEKRRNKAVEAVEQYEREKEEAVKQYERKKEEEKYQKLYKSLGGKKRKTKKNKKKNQKRKTSKRKQKQK